MGRAMLVSDIRVVPYRNWCQLQAHVSSRTLDRPFLLYYRFPPEYESVIDASIGDPFIAMLLVPAMRSGETLEIHAEVSPKLMQTTAKIQQTFATWNPELSQIRIKAPVRQNPPEAPGSRRGLFFSCGIDSFYSLMRNMNGREEDSQSITDLVVVQGLDIHHGRANSGLYDRLLHNSSRVARKFGIRVLPVTTNARELTDRYVHSRWSHGGFLASVGLCLQKVFQEILIASTRSYDQLYPFGSHPDIDPLWSTESLTIVHDGCEATRLDKIRFLADSPLVMETLRVCFQSYATLTHSPRLYNCGMCEKCMRTMVGLHIAGALTRCRTLPRTIDTELFRNIRADPRFFVFTEELIENLGSSQRDLMIKSALQDSLDTANRRRVRRRMLRTGTFLVARYVPGLMPLWRSVARVLLRMHVPDHRLVKRSEGRQIKEGLSRDV